MELTPIRVRGKRRAKNQQFIAPPAKRFHKDPSQKKRAKARRPKASDIEKSMPLEILEHIFWLSENVNFPRASPRLGRLLSGPSTLRETFLSAFGPTWEVWFGCVHGQDTDFPAIHSYAGWEDDADHFGGNPDFQTDVLACSWTTIDLILDCRDIWVRRHARNLSYEHFPIWGSPMSPSSHTDPGVAVETGGIKDSRYYFYHDYEAFRNVEQKSYYDRGLDHPESDPGTRSTSIEVHRSTQIPDELITGPWDEGPLQKFFWLVHSGAQLSSSQTWEVTREGFWNATEDQYAPNMTAIRLLYVLGAFRNWPDHVREEGGFRINMASRSLRKGDDNALEAKHAYIKSLLNG
ncbi:hypothetical protein F4678DRAFT_283458 [Xylaria arbuscula]|nr:hypothetical protein F4678DRAFT_283458 [Xylaria arbuscula]